MSDTHLSDVRFSSFELAEQINAGLNDAGFDYCTPIQALTLPKTLMGQDLAGQAQTGTGKTAAFLVAIFSRLLNKPADASRKPNQPRALVLSPTRELALQIFNDAELLGKHTGLKICVCYGGTGYESQRQAITDGVDILIGTPGRLIDYFKQHVYNLKAIQVAVLDEADRMFDLGFIGDVRYLFRRMPPVEERLSMLFSATLSLRVKELAYEHMNNPESMQAVSEGITASNVVQKAYHPGNDEKIPLLVGLLKDISPDRSLIFVNTKRSAELIQRYLQTNGFESGVLSGDVQQKKRQSLLNRFQTGDLALLIATDVAARGLHIDDVTHVFNFDLPNNAEDYVHRIGRTARAGRSGVAISFVCEDYAFALPEIEDYVGKKIESAPITDDLIAQLEKPAPADRSTKRPPMNKKGSSQRNNSRQQHKPRRKH